MITTIKTILLFCVLFFSQICFASELFFIGNNNLQNLEKDWNSSIPVPLGGDNLRIMRVKFSSDQKLNSINLISSKSKIILYHLPVIKDISNKSVLDVLIPVKNGYSINEGYNYFLLKIKGVTSGIESASIQFVGSKEVISESFSISVASRRFSTTLDLNVWSYFDYNYLVNGLKTEVISDIKAHKVSTIVIPPYVLPDVNNFSKEKISKLSSYLDGAGGFRQYMIYFGGARDNTNEFLSQKWKGNYKKWLEEIVKVFQKSNIPLDRIYLYPIDEPAGLNIKKYEDIYNLTKTLNPSFKFYVTISDPQALSLLRFVDIAQVHSDIPSLIEKALKYRSSKNSIWLYETRFPNSNSNPPRKYLNLAYKAVKYNATGIGIWSYADTKRDDQNMVLKGIASWNLKWKNDKNNFNNSLIYRKSDTIYSSLRWEAVYLCSYEMYWFNLIRQKYGDNKVSQLLSNMETGKLNFNDWENFKLNLIK